MATKSKLSKPKVKLKPAPAVAAKSFAAGTNISWFKQQFKAKGVLAAQAAKAAGLTPVKLSRSLHGERKLQLDEAAALAAMLRVSLEDVLTNAGVRVAPRADGSMKVAGWVDGKLAVRRGAGLLGPASVLNPAPGAPCLEVLRLQTTGSIYEALDGGLVYFDSTTTGVPADAVGKLCVVTAGGKELLRTVKRGYGVGLYNLFPFGVGSAALEEGCVLENAHPVLWLKL